MEDLKRTLKQQIIESLNLQGMKPEDIDDNAPLFGDGLVAVLRLSAFEKKYGFSEPVAGFAVGFGDCFRHHRERGVEDPGVVQGVLFSFLDPDLRGVEPAGTSGMEIYAEIGNRQNLLDELVGEAAGKGAIFCSWEDPVEIPSVGKVTAHIEEAEDVDDGDTDYSTS